MTEDNLSLIKKFMDDIKNIKYFKKNIIELCISYIKDSEYNIKKYTRRAKTLAAEGKKIYYLKEFYKILDSQIILTKKQRKYIENYIKRYDDYNNYHIQEEIRYLKELFESTGCQKTFYSVDY